MFYKILSHKESRYKLFVPTKVLTGHVFVNMDSVSISVGHRSQNVVVVSLPDLNEDEIMISQDVLELLSIPTNIKYQVKFVKNGIRIGPVIGLLMVRSKDSLTKSKLKGFSDYALLYPEIHGLLIAFSVEGIDFTNNLVEGYYYNPDADSKSMLWQEGKFPLPDSIFQRANLPESVMFKLKEVTGNRIFNSTYFDKWEFWKMMSEFDTTREYLPYTRLFSSIDDIDYMLSRYDSAYLKPINGTLSRGLNMVTKEKDSYVFQGNKGLEVKRSSFRDETQNLIEDITKGHRYLIQQALNPLMVDGRHMDFRVIMQKDHTLRWICTTMIAFLGSPGDICSNWGFETTFEEVLAKDFNFSQEDIFKKKQEVIAACRNICEILDLTGDNYGDLGFDVLIDESLKVWILESNKRHYHTAPLWINDVQSFYAVKTNPVKYAAALSGFNVY